jgi:hypothetical protein
VNICYGPGRSAQLRLRGNRQHDQQRTDAADHEGQEFCATIVIHQQPIQKRRLRSDGCLPGHLRERRGKPDVWAFHIHTIAVQQWQAVCEAISRSTQEPRGRERLFSAMPRYFFHVHHHRTELDHEGEELRDHHAAWREATVTAGQILQGLDGNLTPSREWRMVVMDESQKAIFILRISAEKPC